MSGIIEKTALWQYVWTTTLNKQLTENLKKVGEDIGSPFDEKFTKKEIIQFLMEDKEARTAARNRFINQFSEVEKDICQPDPPKEADLASSTVNPISSITTVEHQKEKGIKIAKPE